MRPLVVALIADGFHPFELGVACELFGMDRRDLIKNWYRFAIVGPSRVRSHLGVSLGGVQPLSVASRAHTIVVPGWEGLERPPPPAMLDLLRRAAKRGARIVSFCSGSFALGHAGILRRATTHWMFTKRFAETFPNVELDPKPLWVRARNIWTAAGTAAAIDCGLAVIASDFGQLIANQIARRMLAAPVRAGGQAQFIERFAPIDRDEFEPARRHVLTELAGQHRIATLARVCAMSPRTFARRFVAATGTTPHAWVRQQRLHRAKELLESAPQMSIERVADAVGLEAANLRLAFRSEFEVSPRDYRRTFVGARQGSS